jgi:hypothetical protein
MSQNSNEFISPAVLLKGKHSWETIHTDKVFAIYSRNYIKRERDRKTKMMKKQKGGGFVHLPIPPQCHLSR